MFKSCLFLILGAAVLALGACHLKRASEMEAIRTSLPLPYREGRFVHYDVCSRFWGGQSYVFELSPDAARELRKETRSLPSPPSEYGAWGTDGPLELMCLNLDDAEWKRLKAHARLPDSYAREGLHSRDIFIPSLGLIVGGRLPR